MSSYVGDFADDALVILDPVTTNAADGGRESFSAALEEADITIYSDDGDGTFTAMALDAGTIVINENPGAQVGVYLIAVDMSNDADFTTGKDYLAVLYPSDETVDGQAVARGIGHWSCENRPLMNIGAGVVTATAIGADAITNAKIADNALNTEQFAADFLTNALIADNAFNTEQFAGDFLTSALIADDAISSEHLNTGAFTADAFAANALVAATFAAASLNGKGDWNTVVPDAAGVAPTAVENRQEMDSNSTELAKIGTIPALDAGAQTIGAAIAKLADDNGGADFDAGTDSLEKMRNRGDAAWITATSVTVSDKTGFSLSAAGILAIWDQATAALTTAGRIGKLLVDNINATISSRMATTHLDATGGKLDAVALADVATAVTDEVDADVKKINATTVNGAGVAGDLWRG